MNIGSEPKEVTEVEAEPIKEGYGHQTELRDQDFFNYSIGQTTVYKGIYRLNKNKAYRF